MNLKPSIKAASVALALTTMAQGCGHADRAQDTSAPKTDLGVVGNQQVANMFGRYKQRNRGCRDLGTGRKVLVTGFSLFEGVDYNISGVVADALASPRFTPASISTDADFISPVNQITTMMGRTYSTYYGAKATTRRLTIDGESYQVCVLVLDVLWDLAASIILHEADAFKPELILMSGRGGTVGAFEGGALNHAIPYSGFGTSGAAMSTNTPVRTPILFSVPGGTQYKDRVQMTWDPQMLRDRSRDLVSSIGHSITAYAGARSDNTYICNNVSYVVLNGVTGVDIALAGGMIRQKITPLPDTATGFFHYPSAATRNTQEIRTWVRVLARTIKATLD